MVRKYWRDDINKVREIARKEHKLLVLEYDAGLDGDFVMALTPEEYEEEAAEYKNCMAGWITISEDYTVGSMTPRCIEAMKKLAKAEQKMLILIRDRDNNDTLEVANYNEYLLADAKCRLSSFGGWVSVIADYRPDSSRILISKPRYNVAEIPFINSNGEKDLLRVGDVVRTADEEIVTYSYLIEYHLEHTTSDEDRENTPVYEVPVTIQNIEVDPNNGVIVITMKVVDADDFFHLEMTMPETSNRICEAFKK